MFIKYHLNLPATEQEEFVQWKVHAKGKQTECISGKKKARALNPLSINWTAAVKCSCWCENEQWSCINLPSWAFFSRCSLNQPGHFATCQQLDSDTYCISAKSSEQSLGLEKEVGHSKSFSFPAVSPSREVTSFFLINDCDSSILERP